MCTHLSNFVDSIFYNKIFGCGDFDVVSIFFLVVQFVQCLFFSSEILLIYLNDLRCFRVLCYVLVLQCGNSPEDCCVFLLGCYTMLHSCSWKDFCATEVDKF